MSTIRFRQTGGIAGLVRGCYLDPSMFDEKQRAEFDRLLRRSGLVKGGTARPATRARDLQQYEIEIKSPVGIDRYVFSDLDLDNKVGPLVEFLQARSRPMAPED